MEEAFRDTLDFHIDSIGSAVQMVGIYENSKGGWLNYRAQITRNEGYIEISNIRETFAVRFANWNLRGCAYQELVSIRFGDSEVAVDQQQLERNLPELLQIAKELGQSHLLPVILDSQSLIQKANEKIARRTSAKDTSFNFVREAVAAGCGWECFGCGLSAVAYGISMASLIASCGASFGVGCILALVGSRLAAIELVLECAECFECLN